jgi:hypothetical protein
MGQSGQSSTQARDGARTDQVLRTSSVRKAMLLGVMAAALLLSACAAAERGAGMETQAIPAGAPSARADELWIPPRLSLI